MRDTQLKDWCYDLVDGAAWLNVNNFAIRIQTTDEGVVVDMYPKDTDTRDSIASAYAFFSEA